MKGEKFCKKGTPFDEDRTQNPKNKTNKDKTQYDKKAENLYHSSFEPKGSLVEKYVTHRLISINNLLDWGFLKARWPGNNIKKNYPVLLIPARDKPEGTIKALHMTFLSPDGSGKANLDKPKKDYGKTTGLGWWGGDFTSTTLAIFEGAENAVSFLEKRKDIMVVATFGGSNMKNIIVPNYVTDIILCGDNDKGGLSANEKAAQIFLKASYNVTVIQLPKGKDHNDLLLEEQQTGHDTTRYFFNETPYKLSQSPKKSLSKIQSFCAADLTPEKIDWLWEGRLACSKLAILAGMPGLGKSQLTISLAAIVSNGGQWPANSGQAQKGRVLIVSAEDGMTDTILPRLIAEGADLENIEFMGMLEDQGKNGRTEERLFNIETDCLELEEKMKDLGNIKLVIIDPISAYLGGTDSHNNSQVRAVLAPLSKMAEKYQAAFLLVTHFNKGLGDAMSRMIGSIGMIAAARSGYVVIKDIDNPDRRLFLTAKNNLGVDNTGFAYHIEPVEIEGNISTIRLKWEDSLVEMSADEAMNYAGEENGQPSAKDEAVDFLRDLLAKEALSANEVNEAADANGITKGTLRRAKTELNIKPTKDKSKNGQWMWDLPVRMDKEAIKENLKKSKPQK